MRRIFEDFLSEVKQFVKGNTMDALLPALLFILFNKTYGLLAATLSGIIFSALILAFRLIRGQKWQYITMGFVGVLFASAFALVTDSASSYFLPDIISGGFLLLASVLSLILKRPLAAWLSHLTRGWNQQWFWRDDIRPAYQEVTLIWTGLLAIRLFIMVAIYSNGSVSALFISNMILGLPATLTVLGISYVYGILRLKQLKGPSVDEFVTHSPAPWQGQRKGF